MSSNTQTKPIDRIVMALGGGLILLGTVVLGIVELLAGNSNPMYVGTNGEGETISALSASALETVQSAPVVAPNVRAALVLAGLGVFAAYAVYCVAAHREAEIEEGVEPTAAD
jgi:hypothetical protein